jgi:hypothetical protein
LRKGYGSLYLGIVKHEDATGLVKGVDGTHDSIVDALLQRISTIVPANVILGRVCIPNREDREEAIRKNRTKNIIISMMSQ